MKSTFFIRTLLFIERVNNKEKREKEEAITKFFEKYEKRNNKKQ